MVTPLLEGLSCQTKLEVHALTGPSVISLLGPSFPQVRFHEQRRLQKPSELLKQARDALAEHERARWVEMCERNIIVALEMQQQAQTALHEGNLDVARALASQAHEMHPALREEAERTMRAAVERAGEKSGLISMIAVILIVAVLLGLIIGVGPQLWQWVAR